MLSSYLRNMHADKFKNKHKDEVGIVVCNGPGLNNINCKEISKHIVFGLNRGYLKEDLKIDYLVTIDDLIEDQFREEFESVKCRARFSYSLHTLDNVRLHFTPDVPKFTKDISHPLWQGHSVTYVALQVAYHMGCNPVYIVGMDHYIRYDKAIKVDGKYINQAEDLNHFTKDYFDSTTQYNHQNLRRVELAYGLAYKAYKEANRELWNISYPTQLPMDIIPRKYIEEFLKVTKEQFWNGI
jgi:hypothetical protein